MPDLSVLYLLSYAFWLKLPACYYPTITVPCNWFFSWPRSLKTRFELKTQPNKKEQERFLANLCKKEHNVIYWTSYFFTKTSTTSTSTSTLASLQPYPCRRRPQELRPWSAFQKFDGKWGKKEEGFCCHRNVNGIQREVARSISQQKELCFKSSFRFFNTYNLCYLRSFLPFFSFLYSQAQSG